MSQVFDKVPSLPHAFRGGLAFNQRTVASAAATLMGEAETGELVQGKAIGIVELTNVLTLLESIAMSNGMYLDGTLPPDDVSRVESTLWRLSAESGVPVEGSNRACGARLCQKNNCRCFRRSRVVSRLEVCRGIAPLEY